MITIISGLPRSGTSMMMQMIKQGGIEILTDQIRENDINNPRGYYELEKVKQLPKDNTWLAEAEGKGVKIIAQLLQNLPAEFEYRIVFMKRDINEILKSQKKMLENLGKDPEAGDLKVLARVFEKQLEETNEWLAQQNNTKTLYVAHRDVIEKSQEVAAAVNAFLGGKLNETEMAAAVDPSLYRQRADVQETQEG